MEQRQSGGTLRRFKYPPKTEPISKDSAALDADHPAILEGRSLFPTRVFDAGERPRVLISGFNNAKLGGTVIKGPWRGMPIYQLSLEERATCPRSCNLWRECYGNALPAAVRFKVNDALMEALDREVRALASQNPKGFVVRLHVLGDFPDMAYLDRWDQWINDIAALRVWGYTAHAPTSEIGQRIQTINEDWPDRWSFRFSVAPETPVGPRQVTTIWTAPPDEPTEDVVICPAVTGKTETCGTCALCWSTEMLDKRVVFFGHGKQTARTPREAVAAPIHVARDVVPPLPPPQPQPELDDAGLRSALFTERHRLMTRVTAIDTLLRLYGAPDLDPIVPDIQQPVIQLATPVPVPRKRRAYTPRSDVPMYTDARDAILKDDYPADVDVQVIAAKWEREEGRKPVPPTAIYARAHQLDLRRSPEHMAALTRRRVEAMHRSRDTKKGNIP